MRGDAMAIRLVTVFGASGFIGRHVVQRLAARGIQVRAAVRNPNDALSLKPMGDVGQITPVQANIRNEASVRAAVEGADAVINLVAVLYESGRQRFNALHVAGAENVAKAAKAAGCARLVHISALGADKLAPSRYGRSKAAGEEAVLAAFPEAVILRPSVVFGPGDGFFCRFAEMSQFSPVLPVFGCSLPRVRDGKLDLCGSGGTRFQPVYVGDVADAVLEGVTDKATDGKTYELAGPRIYSFTEIMHLVTTETNRRRLLLPVPFWVGSIVGFFAEWLPVPPITRDQVATLRRDNVLKGDMPGLKELGIEPTVAEAVLPTYLDAYRRGGRYGRPRLV
jgi:uncharacterized protein YbjT (DUF2867 family)